LPDRGVPVSIRPTRTPDAAGASLGHDVAAAVRYHARVLDREDRLEAGTGMWLDGFRADPDERTTTLREAVLRALRLCSEPATFAILEALAEGEGRSPSELEALIGLPRVAVAERVGDLVSAGLAAKIPEANQVVGTAGGIGLVELVLGAVAAASEDLEDV